MSFVRDGVTLTEIGVMFDEAITTRSEWVGKGADGFPVQEGKIIDVVGQSLIIRSAPLRADEEAHPCRIWLLRYLTVGKVDSEPSISSIVESQPAVVFFCLPLYLIETSQKLITTIKLLNTMSCLLHTHSLDCLSPLWD